MDPGLALDYYAFEDRVVEASVRSHDGYVDWPDFAKREFSTDFYYCYNCDLKKWERNKGDFGIWC